jgi:DNA mismatch endonuclease (patch repair protein)
MSAVRSSGTKLERALFEQLLLTQLSGLTFNDRSIVGRPDIADTQKRIAIFIDSCYWHGCRYHLRMPVSNKKYWVEKVNRNRKRDKEVTRKLRKEGWIVLRIWEHSLKANSQKDKVIARIEQLFGCVKP